MESGIQQPGSKYLLAEGGSESSHVAYQIKGDGA